MSILHEKDEEIKHNEPIEVNTSNQTNIISHDTEEEIDIVPKTNNNDSAIIQEQNNEEENFENIENDNDNDMVEIEQSDGKEEDMLQLDQTNITDENETSPVIVSPQPNSDNDTNLGSPVMVSPEPLPGKSVDPEYEVIDTNQDDNENDNLVASDNDYVDVTNE
eukprot:459502_1